METVYAILMSLAIFVCIPVIIGLSISSIFILKDRRIRRTMYTKTIGEAKGTAEQKIEEHATSVNK